MINSVWLSEKPVATSNIAKRWPVESEIDSCIVSSAVSNVVSMNIKLTDVSLLRKTTVMSKKKKLSCVLPEISLALLRSAW